MLSLGWKIAKQPKCPLEKSSGNYPFDLELSVCCLFTLSLPVVGGGGGGEQTIKDFSSINKLETQNSA